VEHKPDLTYSRIEKLKSKKLFEKLFAEGKSVTQFPLRMVYVKTNAAQTVPFKTGVTVTKRKFKSAVKRNRIKRVLREAYRLNKAIVFNNCEANYALLIMYLGNEMPESKQVHEAMSALLKKFKEKVLVS
jgi:ribonuclease P protein component